jgi:hypothetical protein
VDDAYNRSEELSISSSPVWLRNVIPPRAPVLTKVLGGDRKITLRWASNREPDLKEYRIYHTKNKEDARDIRLMGQPIYIVTVSSGDPFKRPSEVSWTDQTVQNLVSHFYRVVAVDNAGHLSEPSKVVVGRAFDHSPPAIPKWHSAKWIKLDENGNPHMWSYEVSNFKPAIELQWVINQAGSIALVHRKLKDTADWISVSPWLRPIKQMDNFIWKFRDGTVKEQNNYVYRVKLVNASGKTTLSEEAKPVKE